MLSTEVVTWTFWTSFCNLENDAFFKSFLISDLQLCKKFTKRQRNTYDRVQNSEMIKNSLLPPNSRLSIFDRFRRLLEFALAKVASWRWRALCGPSLASTVYGNDKTNHQAIVWIQAVLNEISIKKKKFAENLRWNCFSICRWKVTKNQINSWIYQLRNT